MKKMLSFWITNVSKRDVSLADLNLTVRSFTSVNLLDNRHYSYTLEQLLSSENHGSIFKKRHIIKVRKTAPEMPEKQLVVLNTETLIPDRSRSIIVINDEKYDELSVFDDSFPQEDPSEKEENES